MPHTRSKEGRRRQARRSEIKRADRLHGNGGRGTPREDANESKRRCPACFDRDCWSPSGPDAMWRFSLNRSCEVCSGSGFVPENHPDLT
jgi:hypothetical protein